MKALIVVDTSQADSAQSLGEMISAAKTAGATAIDALVASSDHAKWQPMLSLDGVSQIVWLKHTINDFAPEILRTGLTARLKMDEVDLILSPMGQSAQAYMPAVAAATGGAFASDVLELTDDDGALICTRSILMGQLHLDVTLPAGVQHFVLPRPGAFAPATTAGQPGFTEIPASESSRLRVLETLTATVEGRDIAEADLLVCAGRGIENEKHLPTFETLAQQLNGMLCATRAVVDGGWITSDRQVGQSGKTVAPDVYLAFGVAGAVQHIVGMKDSRLILAVNTDPDAPIFSVAHYGAVCDARAVAAEMLALTHQPKSIDSANCPSC
jgi:electron transfer flavoprotein alpha subunit